MRRLLLLSLLLPVPSLAAESEYLLVIQDHRFQPAQLIVPAGKKIRLTVANRDATPEEFESYTLDREKVIPAKTKTMIYVGPLDPGPYPYYGEFHQKTAQGVVVAQ